MWIKQFFVVAFTAYVLAIAITNMILICPSAAFSFALQIRLLKDSNLEIKLGVLHLAECSSVWGAFHDTTRIRSLSLTCQFSVVGSGTVGVALKIRRPKTRFLFFIPLLIFLSLSYKRNQTNSVVKALIKFHKCTVTI